MCIIETMEGIFKTIKPLIARRLRVAEETILLQSNFRKDFGADSIDLVELVMSLEDEYGVEFSDDIVESIQTVAQAVAYLEQLLDGKR
ncbi:MAG: acyl carrier protein [Symbiobacteriaceae bacterium]|nr:acyl carrier protein [Symbiobacteriaceae bacterium]